MVLELLGNGCRDLEGRWGAVGGRGRGILGAGGGGASILQPEVKVRPGSRKKSKIVIKTCSYILVSKKNGVLKPKLSRSIESR